MLGCPGEVTTLYALDSPTIAHDNQGGDALPGASRTNSLCFQSQDPRPALGTPCVPHRLHANWVLSSVASMTNSDWSPSVTNETTQRGCAGNKVSMKNLVTCLKVRLHCCFSRNVPGTSWAPSPGRPRAPLTVPHVSVLTVAKPARMQAPGIGWLPASCQSCFSGTACCSMAGTRCGAGEAGSFCVPGSPNSPPVTDSCPFCILNVPSVSPFLPSSAAGLVRASRSLSSLPVSQAPQHHPQLPALEGTSEREI